MLKNHNHDLVHQLSETSDSAWRIKKYLGAAKGCKRCVALWKKLEKDYGAHIKTISAEIAAHVKEKRFA